ncbi:MAG TPA: sulfotransferase [Pyrinomonadaceae bacterium]|jgi:hypothetical protein|nr:sulfotransferase [Pyrinomonadaceae bacterium]
MSGFQKRINRKGGPVQTDIAADNRNTSRLVPPVADEILLILAPPRSFSWTVCAMLGQHPQMYGLPEMHLFGAKTMEEWWGMCSTAKFAMSHGTLRAVAELCFGAQNEETISLAAGWLRRRAHFTTGMILEVLAEKVSPRILVDKSPNIVYRVQSMEAAHHMFPRARFLHLVRHPLGHGRSVMEAVNTLGSVGPVPDSHWLRHLAAYPHLFEGESKQPDADPDLDPQRGWYALNMHVCDFLRTVPESQQMRMRAEDLLTQPDETLRRIAGWMNLRADDDAIEQMKQPEHSPYACPGPSNARFGNDWRFLKSPSLESDMAGELNLAGPLDWCPDGRGFAPEVVELAHQFGYQ